MLVESNRSAVTEPEPKPSVRMRSATWILASQFASLAASFPLSVLLARSLGASGKGALTVVQLVATFSALLFGFGLAQAVTYYSARQKVRGRGAVLFAWVVGAGVSCVLGLVGVLAADDLAATLRIDQPEMLALGLVLTGPVVASQILNGHSIGAGRIKQASAINAGSILYQLLVALTLSFSGALDLQAAILTWASAVVCVAVVFTLLAWRLDVRSGGIAVPWQLFGRVWRYGLAAWPAGILGMASQRFDVFLLAHFANTAEVGIYSVAVTIAELCWYIPNALGGVLMPKVAAEGDAGLEVVIRTARTTWVITAATGVILVLVGGPVLPVVFGPEFSRSVMPLALILPGIVSGSLAAAAGAYLAGTGRPFTVTVSAAAGVGVNVVVNVILIPTLGARGAAISSSLSYTVSAAVVASFFLKHTGVSLRTLVVPARRDFAELLAAMLRVLRRNA